MSTNDLDRAIPDSDFTPLARLGLAKWLLLEADRLGLLPDLVKAILRAARQVFHADRLVNEPLVVQQGADAVYKTISSAEAFLKMGAAEQRAVLQLLRESRAELLERQLAALRAERAQARDQLRTLQSSVAGLREARLDPVGDRVSVALSRLASLVRFDRALRADRHSEPIPVHRQLLLQGSLLTEQELLDAVGRHELRGPASSPDAITPAQIRDRLRHASAAVERARGSKAARAVRGVIKGTTLTIGEDLATKRPPRGHESYEVLGSISFDAMAATRVFFGEPLADVLARVGSPARRLETDPKRVAFALADILLGPWIRPDCILLMTRLGARADLHLRPPLKFVLLENLRRPERRLKDGDCEPASIGETKNGAKKGKATKRP